MLVWEAQALAGWICPSHRLVRGGGVTQGRAHYQLPQLGSIYQPTEGTSWASRSGLHYDFCGLLPPEKNKIIIIFDNCVGIKMNIIWAGFISSIYASLHLYFSFCF